MKPAREPLEDLIARHFDGLLDEGEEAELAELLHTSTAARTIMAAYMRLEGNVAYLGKIGCLDADLEEVAAPASIARRSARSRHRSSVRRARGRGPLKLSWMLAAAAGLLLLLGLSVFLLRGGAQQDRVAGLRKAGPAGSAGSREQVGTPGARTPVKEAGDGGPVSGIPPTRDPSAGQAPPPVSEVETAPPRDLPPIPPVPELAPPGSAEVAAGPTPPEPQPRTGAEGTAPDAGQEKTPRPLARIAKIEGRILFARGAKGRWIQAVEGIQLLAGDRIDARGGMVRLDASGGASIYANRATSLRLDSARFAGRTVPLVVLREGEVFIVDEHQLICVETPDGVFVPVGTRFEVTRRSRWTVLVVEEGEVRAGVKGRKEGTDTRTAPAAAIARLPRLDWVRQALRVPAGHELRVRRGLAPGKPVRVQVGKARAWIEKLRPAWTAPIALYAFRAGAGTWVADTSGVGEPLKLEIRDAANVRWLPGGGLEIRQPTRITSAGPATKIIDACRAANAITVEAWLKLADPAQTHKQGSPRIVSMSEHNKSCNFMLGINGLRQTPRSYGVRLRTSATTENGTRDDLRAPSILATSSDTTSTRVTHVAFTRDARGEMRFYLDGVERARGAVAGDFSNWNDSFRLTLANEWSHNRPWLGTFYRLAIYARALTAAEVRGNFAAGPAGNAGVQP